MNEQLVLRVKNALNKMYYSMNDSWLTDCIEFFLNDHENPTQEEIQNFVINQWVLCDLREINNEKGCLPRNLVQQKCTTLSGKYILQMDKMYDISQSKYKQLEKIRNVSSENVEATEIENAKEDKFQASWEPKSKRMLQLFLSDGIQDVLAIEYKPIVKLKDSLYPGYKLLIKGPVICRKGVILLEEHHIAEIGGEVDSLLIVNAVENVFARALNLEENPDPYNDNKTQTGENLQNTQKINQIDDEFDFDSEMLDQIEKQIQGENLNTSSSSITTTTKTDKKQNSQINENKKYQQQTTCISNSTHSSTTSSRKNENYSNDFFNGQISSAQIKTNFVDNHDSFLERINRNTLENLPTSKSSSLVKNKQCDSKSSTTKSINHSRMDDFPDDDELYDLLENQSPFFTEPKIQNRLQTTTKVHTLNPVLSSESNNYPQTASGSKILDKPDDFQNYEMEFDYSPSPPKLKKSGITRKMSASYNTDFHEDDFDLQCFNIETDKYEDYFRDNKKSQSEQGIKLSQVSKSSSNNSYSEEKQSLYQISNTQISAKSIKSESKSNLTLDNFDMEFQEEFNNDFDIKTTISPKFPIETNKRTKDSQNSNSTESMKVHKTNIIPNMRSQNKTSSMEITGTKRLATVSPSTSTPQKMRCVESTPKKSNIADRKITNFLMKPNLLNEETPKFYEYIRDVLKNYKTEEIHTVVRGKVINVAKLTMLKENNENFFFLEGCITDKTETLDVIFSSKVLETIIGYSCQEFCKKRKQSKTDPSIKNQLRDDLSKAQDSLINMDALMEIKLKKNSKAIIIKTITLTKEEKKAFDERLHKKGK